MSTAKILQKPKIIEILGSTIRIAHPDISRNFRTYLAAPIAAAGTAMSVLDNEGFKDDDWFIVGAVGDKQTEEDDVNGAVTRGTAMTVTNTLKLSHTSDSPVTAINERKIRIYGAATDGGAGTLITSIDALAADAFSIQWSRAFSEYTLQSGDTTFAYYYVKFDDGTTLSPASDYVLAAGYGVGAVENLIEAALDLTDTRLDDRKITRKMCVRWADNAQDAIKQFIYKDPITQNMIKKDWSFETYLDDSSILLTQNENVYALSGLAYTMKYPNSDRSIINVRLGDKKPLNQVHIDEIDRDLADKPRTETTVLATVALDTLTVTSTAEFADSGSLYLGALTITYTGKTATTFTGIPAAGTYSITAQQAIGTVVWQGVSPGLPTKYAVYEGNIILERPVASDYVGMALKVRFFREIPRLSETSDATVVPFTNVFQYYIGSIIEERKANSEKATKFMDKFNDLVLSNAVAEKVPTQDTSIMYTFSSLSH